MKNNFYKKIALVTASFCFLALEVHAQTSPGGAFIEPSITYDMGSTSSNYPAPLASSSGRSDGLGLGARLGMHVDETFFLGLDLRYSRPQFQDSSVNYNAKATSTNWGPVIGAQMPSLGIRAWGSYIADGELNPEQSGNFDVKLMNSRGYRLGAGFRVAAVSFDLEYQQVKYDRMNLEQVGPFATNADFSNVNLENRAWIAGVSFPFEL